MPKGKGYGKKSSKRSPTKKGGKGFGSGTHKASTQKVKFTHYKKTKTTA